MEKRVFIILCESLVRGVVSLSVFIYEVGSDDVKCAAFTYVVFTSLYSQNYKDSAAADLKNGFAEFGFNGMWVSLPLSIYG